MNLAKHRGFTLIEALLALAIVGILAALALPAYQSHLLRAGRMQAKQELMEVAVDLERYHSRNGRYVSDAKPMQPPVIPGRRRQIRNGSYVIEVNACPERDLRICFVATARPQGAQARDACGLLTLTSDGARGADGGDGEVCWQ